jgi:hypothetical protein
VDLNLPAPVFAVKPLALYYYFDKIQVWLKRPLDDQTIRRLHVEYGRRLHIRNKPARFNSSFRQRIQLTRPRPEALRLLAGRADAYLNYAEVARDAIYADPVDVEDAFDALAQYLVRSWHGKRQLIKQFYMDWDKQARATAQSRYDANSRSAPNTIFFYKQPHSRITGELNCLHLEWRLRGDKALRSAGLKGKSDLVGFDHEAFWAKRLKLYTVEAEQLGRLIRNGSKGLKSRRSPEVNYCTGFPVNLDQRLGTILILGSGSIQALVDRYRRFRVGRILRPISVAELSSSIEAELRSRELEFA